MTGSQLNAYLHGMSTKQRAAFRRLVQLFGKQRSLQDYHAAALALAELQSLNTGYGSRWMAQLCQALSLKGVSISTSLGYRLLKLAEMFPGPEGTLRIRVLDGKVPWDSMMRILHVADERKRASILRTVSAKHHCTREVRRLISKMTAYRCPRGGHRLEVSEEHPNQALRNLVAFTSKWRLIRGEWLDKDDQLLKTVTKFLGGQTTDDFLEDLKCVVGHVNQMAESAKNLSTHLTSLLQELPEK